jgi:hypothetical protein
MKVDVNNVTRPYLTNKRWLQQSSC